MLPEYYEASFVMTDVRHDRVTKFDIWKFRSQKSHKWYIVEVERYAKDFLGMKFYFKALKNSPNRFSILTHDFEPRRIVLTCIQIMLRYYQDNRQVSFGFIAAPDLKEDIENKPDKGNRRFRFYRRMMVNYFGPETFLQVYDKAQKYYLMINQSRLKAGEVSITEVQTYINSTYEGVVEIPEHM